MRASSQNTAYIADPNNDYFFYINFYSSTTSSTSTILTHRIKLLVSDKFERQIKSNKILPIDYNNLKNKPVVDDVSQANFDTKFNAKTADDVSQALMPN